MSFKFVLSVLKSFLCYNIKIQINRKGGVWFVKNIKFIFLIILLLALQVNLNAQEKTFTERDITYQSGSYTIKGTLTIPHNLNEKAPAVLFLTGSGPQPRDGIEEGDKTGIPPFYRILAHSLAEKGIITLRCDDRTYLLRELPLSEDELIYICEELTLEEEYIEDGINGFNFLKKQPEVDPEQVYLMGHSLGGFAVSFVAEQTEPAGVILLAPGGENLFDSMIRQANYQIEYYEINYPGQIPEADMEAAKKEIAYWGELKEAVSNKTLPHAELILGATDKYYYDLYDRDVFNTAKSLTCPILHLWGEYDPNITKEDFDRWYKELSIKSDYTAVTFPGLNHYFYTVDEYYPIGVTIVQEKEFEPEIIDIMGDWILEQ